MAGTDLLIDREKLAASMKMIDNAVWSTGVSSVSSLNYRNILVVGGWMTFFLIFVPYLL